MDDLLSLFAAESREMLDTVAAEVVAWEAAPGEHARLDAIFRCVHTIKGNSGFFDLPRITALAHAAEDALADVRSGGRDAGSSLVSAVLAALDRLADLVEELEGGPEVAGDDRLILQALSGEAPAAQAAPARPQAAARTVRLPVALLDRLMNGISDLVLARNGFARVWRDGATDGSEERFERLSAAIAEVREAVTRTRMQRLDTVCAPLPRLVRDLCGELGCDAVLELDGDDVELDREMIELIRDPITQMIRNALAHGIESPAERLAGGKAAQGRLRLSACQSGNSIRLLLSDDGRGIDRDALARRAVAERKLTPSEAASLSPAERLELLFLPGLSTAGAVTSLSGRGVGMDVVRANMERIGGTVSVESLTGEGTCFTLAVPLTLTIIPGLTLRVGDQFFALARTAVEEIVRVGGAGVRIDRLAGAAMLFLRGRRIPILNLGRVLALASGGEGAFIVLVRATGGALYGLAVDAVTDQDELVVKPAAPALVSTGLYAGTTMTEDGRPILLLNPTGLAVQSGMSPVETPEPLAATSKPEEPRPKALLFTSICGARRAVPLTAVTRIEEVAHTAVAIAGGRFHVSLADRLLPLAGCGTPPRGARFHAIRISDGLREIAYAAASVIDTVELPAAGTSVPLGDTGSLSLIDREPVELIDLHGLFTGNSMPSVHPEVRPLCLLPVGNAWVDTFLRPLVESAGYCTASVGVEQVEAHLTVIVEGDEPIGPVLCGEILRLRNSPEPGQGSPESIYRYDRAQLLRALASAKGPR